MSMEAARKFMARFFSVGNMGSQINSHEPHETLNKVREAYNECLAAGWVTEEPFNEMGSITIRPTLAGLEIAREEFRNRLKNSGIF